MDKTRKTAFDILLKIDKDKAYSNIALDDSLKGKDDVDRGFVRDLVYGVTSKKYYLDFYIDQLAKKGAKSLKPGLLMLIRMALYQIEFMDRVPDHASCDESVKIARKLYGNASGIVNGIIRNFIRNRESLKSPESIEDEIKKVSAFHSVEHWIAEAFVRDLGASKAEEVLVVLDERAPLTITVNTLKNSPDKLQDILSKDGITCRGCEGSSRSLHVSGSGLLETKAYSEGRFFIQDEASSVAVETLSPEPGDTVIDVCAAPGGKSFAAALMMDGKGSIKAFDVYENKLKLMQESAKRLGIDIIETKEHDSVEPAGELKEAADIVICDVPCSGLGVIRRKPEIRYKDLSDGGRSLAEKQLKILKASSTYVKPGGKIMYSTCTVNSIENSDVVKAFLEKYADYDIVEEKQLLPGKGGHDGFYYCVMKRESNKA